jgi:putative hydrolase of HD superfamily
MQDKAAKLIAFFKEIEKFKVVERKLWTSNMERMESDADHAWHICMMILLMEKELKGKVDILHAMKIALTHDLVEIYSGDELTFTKNKERARIEEEKSARKLQAQLPEDLGKELYDLWEEYEHVKTPEAKLVQALDKFEPLIQNLVSDGKSWKVNKITKEQIFENKRQHIENVSNHELLVEIYKQVLDEVKKKEW